MKLFNRFSKEDNFRWLGFRLLKTTFGFGFSFGKPIWIIPSFILAINDPKKSKPKRIFDCGGGWLLLSVRIQVLYGR